MPLSSASLEVSTPSTFSNSEQRHKWMGLPHPPACAFRLSQPPGAFIRPEPAPALFHAGSALGVTLQSFVPPAQPCAVSSAIPLLAFQPPSGSCSTRESATRPSCSSYGRARSSPGLFPLQGSLAPCDGSAFTDPPLMWFAFSDASGRTSSTPGFLSPRAWPISLETADPPGVSGLMIHHIRTSNVGFWSRLLTWPGVRHRPRDSPSSNPRRCST
jgi:hypothetical protein